MELQTSQQTIDALRHCIKDASRIVAILGIEVMVEGGAVNLNSNEETSRIYEKYGYCPEELFSSGFCATKKDRFYSFYKQEVMQMKMSATPAYEALYKLEQQGKLYAVINQNYHAIPQPYHFHNVIELNGSTKRFHCQKCHREYDDAYVLASQGVPTCKECNGVLRPDIRLIGERVDNRIMTQALEACDRADVVIIMGRNMYSDRLQSAAPDLSKTTIIFSDEKYLRDSRADYIIYDEIQQIMPLLVL